MSSRKLIAKAKGVLASIAALALVGAAGQALADYPERPINLIIGFKAGGNTDASGRAIANALQEELGNPVVVVNKPGASSMIAAKSVAAARPDGYTLWFGSSSTLMLQNAIGKTDLDLMEDFDVIGFTGELVPSIAVPADSPHQTMGDLLKAAKDNPGKLRWSHGGRGSAYMAAGAGLIAENGLEVIEVPFSGGSGSRNAIIGKQVDFGIVGESDGESFGTKLRILAAFRDTREGALNPDTPAMGEEGVNFLQIDSTVGVLSPKGTPANALATLRDALAEAKQSDAFQEAMTKLSIPVARLNQEQQGPYLEALQQRIGKVAPLVK